MHQPYTYLIKHIPTGKVYYGLRYAKGCHPKDFWVKYFTSSKDVRAMITKYGKDSFVPEIRRVFTDPIHAIKWELTVLRRMKVLQRTDFINRNIPGTTLRFILSEETKQKMRKPKPAEFSEGLRGNKRACVTKGVPKTKEHSANISKGKKGKNFGRVGKNAPRYGQVKSVEELLKMSLSMKKKKWMNNGVNCAFVEPDDIDVYLARGYNMGRGSLKFTKE
jgi:hypothetical protein